MRALAADLILVLHFAFVAFVVGGLALIWMGAALRWSWVRSPSFRIAHLAAIGFVAIESVIGMMCPLTVWENALRGRQSDVGFIADWIHRIMFYELPEAAFTSAYLAFGALVAATWWLVPPRHGSDATHRASRK